MPWTPRKILVEEEAAGSAVARSVLAHFPDSPVERLERIKDYDGRLGAEDLAVARQRGRFIKKCPGTPAYTCCDYYILNVGIGCRLSCSYCYLHHYMNTPFTIYSNTDDLIAQANDYFRKRPRRRFRVGSGEFIDSLDFDEITGMHDLLVPELTGIPNVTFEIKTKSDRVDHLLGLEHHGRAVVSWSVNPEIIRIGEESLSAPLAARLRAAAACVAAGYRVGFHFDPLIYYPGWAQDYEQVVDEIFAHVRPKNIAWISLGGLRFNPSLKPIMEARFPESRLTSGELVRGLDGKLRYFIAIRRKMFRRLNRAVQAHGPNVAVYLCMENQKLATEVGVTGLSS